MYASSGKTNSEVVLAMLVVFLVSGGAFCLAQSPRDPPHEARAATASQAVEGPTDRSPSVPETAEPPVPFGGSCLTIGYLSRAGETALSTAFFEGLAEHIQGQDEVMRALSGIDIATVAAKRAEDHVDLVRRMDHDEFGLVFCSAMAFVEQKGHYTAMLQTRSPRDNWGPTGVPSRQGLIIAHRRNRLLKEGDELDASDKRRLLEGATMAFVSNHSAVGYLYPRLKMMREFGLDRPRHFIFCDTSEEVAKFVINGLADAGALDAKALEDVVAQIPGQPAVETLVSIIERTAPLPTDPVAVHDSMAPSRSPVGRALAKAIKQYCRERLGGRPIDVVDAFEGPYQQVRLALEELRKAEQGNGD